MPNTHLHGRKTTRQLLLLLLTIMQGSEGLTLITSKLVLCTVHTGVNLC